MFIDLASTQDFIKDEFKVVLSASNAFDLTNTIVYQLANNLKFPDKFAETAVTAAVLASIEKVMGINIVRYTTHAIFEAASVTLEARRSDTLNLAQLTVLVHGQENLEKYQKVAKKVWCYLVAKPEVMAKVTICKKHCNLAIVACAIHRFNDDGHSWKSDHTEDPTKVAGRAVAVAGSDKQAFVEFMSKYGHDIWHYLTDKCITRLSYILTCNKDYGVSLKNLPPSETAMIERYGIDVSNRGAEVDVRVNMSTLRTRAPDLYPAAEDEPMISDVDEDEDGADDKGEPAKESQGFSLGSLMGSPSVKAPAKVAAKPPKGSGATDKKAKGGDGPAGDAGGITTAEEADTVRLVELIAVGQAAKDRFPPGTMGKSALITGVSLAIAMIRHIARKVSIPQSSAILSSMESAAVALAARDLTREDLVNAKNSMGQQIATAWGYCRELTELEQLANMYQSLVNFAQRYPSAVASGATLARLMKEVVPDPTAVEDAIVGAMMSMSAMHAGLYHALGYGGGLPDYPTAGGISIFRTAAQLSNERERRRIQAEIDHEL